MKALVLGARGAVGRVVAAELLAAGDEVIPAGRTAVPGGVRVELPTEDGWRALKRESASVDVVVNASGIEDARIATYVGTTPLVEISATAAYLAQLRDANVVLGAGLAPGLSTVLARALASEPGDEIDLLVMLGSGEVHGPAAVAWTADLIGAEVYQPAEGGVVRNLTTSQMVVGPDRRRRRYLRADFPDNLLLADLRVRSYLTLSSGLATATLAAVAHVPSLKGLIARAPHLGSSDWHVIAVNRRTGERLATSGAGQSETTGLLTALAAQRVAGTRPGIVTMDEIVALPDLLGVTTPDGRPAVALAEPAADAPKVLDL
ncbi:saccharopine dehydrogenase family protein [Kineosporia babensis]|uniref:Saccharopine dehydrogenase n=1 Tax=Kineosporia babensis TaxID=499548 RepID=A0A9X1N8L4_9ACTN|nr:hypothetical protein [Kineosporia babensis]MCD5310387.1 hypothetical protein [Kineosporia babensis]